MFSFPVKSTVTLILQHTLHKKSKNDFLSYKAIENNIITFKQVIEATKQFTNLHNYDILIQHLNLGMEMNGVVLLNYVNEIPVSVYRFF